MSDSRPEVGGRVGKMCQPCLKKDNRRAAKVFCTTCNEFQCNYCTKAHTTFAFMKDHTLLSVTEGLLHVDKKLDMKGLDVCRKHDQPFEFYCKDHKVLLCSKCVIGGHRKCGNVPEIEHIAKAGQCDKLRNQLQAATTTSNQAVENLTEAESCLTADIEKIPKKLAEMRKTIIKTFDEFAVKVTQDADSYKYKTLADWKKSKIECESKIKSMESSFKTIDTIATNGTPSQQCIASHAMTETIQEQVKNTDSLCSDVHTLNVSCDFDKQFDTLKSNILSAIRPGEFEMKYTVPKKTKLVPIASIDLKQTGDGVKEPLYTGLDFLSDGRLVVVDNENDKCLLYDENLRLLSTYKLPHHPQCVAVVSDDEVAITTGGKYRLDFLHVSKSNVITLNRTCKVSVRYHSISMKDEDNLVVSTYDHTPPVRILSMSGEEKDFDIAFPSKKYPLGTSSCTYIRGQDKVVLTDAEADTVFMYDVKSGEQVAIRGQLGHKPHGVAVGVNGNVFVGCGEPLEFGLDLSDWGVGFLGRSCLRLLTEITPTGRVLSSHKLDMVLPNTLAVSKDGARLAVSNRTEATRKLTLYEIQSL